ncbi:MAG: hypothetical protein FJ095_08170 [Deltaproteobacteria bacterium]|nr:hypothetical protein [Deltaproteobacteria bacterium]
MTASRASLLAGCSAAVVSVLAAACGGQAPTAAEAPVTPKVATARIPATESVERADGSPPPVSLKPSKREVREAPAVLADVAARHELEVVRPVASEVVSRARGIELIVQKTERDLPREFLEAQGELFALLELSDPDYRFVEGMFAQVRENVAGFYDPDDDKLYLLDDLDDVARAPTLAHELVHALQDQHFDLGARLTYRRGQVDAAAAVGAFAEGDATSAMFSHLPDGALSVETLRRSLAASVALSSTGLNTPPALQASLIAPYVDGYRFVEALRARGGWSEVNRAWRDPPRSTEQLLHLDKYDAREAPLEVAEPTSAPFGVEARILDSDVVGEQGLRIVLEPWSSPPEAAAAAAGWGGDRYVLVSRSDGARREVALAWRLVFDSEVDAVELERLVAKRHPACRDRGVLGPLAWRRRGREVALVAGPLARDSAGKASRARGASCDHAKRWVDDLLR